MAFATKYTSSLERAAKRSLKASKLKTSHDPFPQTYYTYNTEGDLLYKPLIHWRTELNDHPHSSTDFTRTDVKFGYKLFTAENDPSGRGRDQQVLAVQSVDRLKKTSTAFIAAHTGYGKCLGKGVPVMFFNGEANPVESVRRGDLLMGEGGSPRTVLGTCKGVDTLYKIVLGTGESFVTNGDHIIVVKFLAQGRVFGCAKRDSISYVSWFTGKRMVCVSYDSEEDAKKASKAVIDRYGTMFELSVNAYLRMGKDVATYFRMYWSKVSYVPKYGLHKVYSQIETSPLVMALKCTEGKLTKIPSHYAMGSERVRIEILSMFPRTTASNGISTIKTHSWSMALSVIGVLRSLGHYCTLQNSKDVIFSTHSFEHCYISFHIVEQDVGEYYGFELDGDGRFLLSNFIVSHNTSMGTYLLSKFRYKTAILCPLEGLKKQWKEEIEKFTEGTASIQIVRGKTPLKESADVYIIGSKKASTMNRDDLLDIGMVIIDEAHMNTACVFTSSLLNFQPRYVVGLSATPDRADGLTSLIEHHFGPSSEFLYRREVKEFTVVKYSTSYALNDEFVERRGAVCLDWTSMISKLSEIEKRMKEIAQLVIKHPEHKIMVLCGRKYIASNLFLYLQKKEESVALYIGTAKDWDRSKRVLIAGVKKGGVGLNDPDLTMLILEADMKDVRQCEGRIRTTQNIVYDIVDDHRLIESHWCKRRAWYRNRGAIILDKDGNTLHKIKSTTAKKRFLKTLT